MSQNLALLKRVFFIITFFMVTSLLYGQALTKSLFMQIKSPKLESASGTLIDEDTNKYYIHTSDLDSIDISFVITVPKEMLSEQWAISLTPSIESTRKDGRLKDVVVKGWKFAEAQDEDYTQYDEYINSIVDSSQYEDVYVDHDRLTKEIEQRHDLYWKYYYDEWERQIEYEIWKSKQDGSSKMFSAADRKTYSDQLYKQYLLRIKNQTSRYLKAGMDTTGLHAKYMKEFRIHEAKMPRYIVDNDMSIKSVPQKYKDIYESRRTLDDITDSMQDLLEKKDSTLMALLPALDYKKIVENEKRTMLKKDIRDNLIRLPKSENAISDTVVYDLRNDYQYKYTYRYPVVKETNDTVTVKLGSKILATDRSGFTSTAEEALTYIVSSEPNTEAPETKAKVIIFNGGIAPPLANTEGQNKASGKKSKEEKKELLQTLSEKLQGLGASSYEEKKSVDQVFSEDDNQDKKSERGLGSRIRVLE